MPLMRLPPSGEDDVVLHLGLELRVEAGDHLGGGLGESRKDALAGSPDLILDVVLHGLAVDGDLHLDVAGIFTDEAEVLLVLADHVDVEAGVGVFFAQVAVKLLVYVVAGHEEGLLVLLERVWRRA